MNSHRITVTQTTPDGDIQSFTVDVIGLNTDSALCTIYKWYDRATHYLHEVEPDRGTNCG